MSFFTGTPSRMEQVSNLNPQQQSLFDQLIKATQGRGAGGAFGESSDYYRDLLSNNSEDLNALQNPEIRRFQEQTVPDIAEQFAGMGSGALSSSGFRNAAVNAGSDLSERLGSIRAQLRQQAAQGLVGIGQQGLQPNVENVFHPPTPGIIESFAPALGSALTALAGGSVSGSSMFGRRSNTPQFGSTSPYGNNRGF